MKTWSLELGMLTLLTLVAQNLSFAMEQKQTHFEYDFNELDRYEFNEIQKGTTERNRDWTIIYYRLRPRDNFDKVTDMLTLQSKVFYVARIVPTHDPEMKGDYQEFRVSVDAVTMASGSTLKERIYVRDASIGKFLYFGQKDPSISIVPPSRIQSLAIQTYVIDRRSTEFRLQPLASAGFK